MKILDMCCGGRMFWLNKQNKETVFCDNRVESSVLCDGRVFEIKPDVVCDFTELPFAEGSFRLVVFDPPHLLKAGNSSWLAKKYGVLPSNWKAVLAAGFREAFRVLEDYGILIFKWSEVDIKLSEILKLTEQKPLFGHKSGKLNNTHWLCFMKSENKGGDAE